VVPPDFLREKLNIGIVLSPFPVPDTFSQTNEQVPMDWRTGAQKKLHGDQQFGHGPRSGPEVQDVSRRTKNNTPKKLRCNTIN